MEWTVIVLDSVPCVLYKTVCVEWTVVALCVVQDGVWSGQCILCVVQDSVCGVDSNGPVCCTGQCVWSGQ